jgi:hypothetical protein
MDMPAYPYPPTPKRSAPRSTTLTKVPVRPRDAHDGHPRGHDHGQARTPSRGGWSTRPTSSRRCPTRPRPCGHPAARPAGGRGRRSQRDGRLGGRRAARVHVLERHDELNVEYFREPFLALRQPVVASPHDQKPNWWIARELAVKLGLERVLSLEGHRGVPRTPGQSRRTRLRHAQTRRHPPRPAAADLLRGRGARRVRHAVGQDRILFLAAGEGRLRPGSPLHAARFRSARILPSALRPRADALLQPHPHEPAAVRT